MEVLLVLVIVAALLALGYAAFNFASVKKMDEGNARMSEIAEAIRVGANAFITYVQLDGRVLARPKPLFSLFLLQLLQLHLR